MVRLCFWSLSEERESHVPKREKTYVRSTVTPVHTKPFGTQGEILG